MSSIIQLCDLHNETLDLIIREKRVYHGLPSLNTEMYHNNHQLPTLGILKVYHQQDLSNAYLANLKQPAYFLLYILSLKASQMNISSVISIENYCPHTEVVFQKNITHLQYLSQGKFV